MDYDVILGDIHNCLVRIVMQFQILDIENIITRPPDIRQQGKRKHGKVTCLITYTNRVKSERNMNCALSV